MGMHGHGTNAVFMVFCPEFPLHMRVTGQRGTASGVKDVQELTLDVPAGRSFDIAAISMALMSQAPTLRSLSMRHDTLPPQYLHALASLQSLTLLKVSLCQ